MDDLTPNAVIAWNVRRLRRDRGWTQAELAERLSERDDKPWTFSMVSDAETAGRTDRDRQFTVNEVSVLARVFQVSVIALFVPDPMQLVRIGNGVYTREDYVDLVLQFPPETMPDGFERRLQNQYAVRNRESTDRLARSRPARRADPSSDLAKLLLQQFLHFDRGEHDGER
jgi:transcriptional regulator with XRE-family HTH domain